MCDWDDGSAASGWEVLTVTREVQHLFEVAMDQCVEGWGMSYAQYRALEVLLAQREMHVSALARHLRITRQAALATVAKLDRARLVETIREAHATYVVPSDVARAEIAKLRRAADVPTDIERRMSVWELGRLVELLTTAANAVRPPNRPYWWLDRHPNY